MSKQNLKVIGISLMCSLLAFVIIKYYIEKYNLEKEYRITTGTVYDFIVMTRAGYRIDFNYYVNGIKYESDYIVCFYPKSLVGKRFFVKFSPSNPKNCMLLLESPVPKGIQKAPSEGWTQIPN
jgi:hypothetical protein